MPSSESRSRHQLFVVRFDLVFFSFQGDAVVGFIEALGRHPRDADG
jgi:hypothetical protein